MSTWDSNPVPAVPAARSCATAHSPHLPHLRPVGERWHHTHNDWHPSNSAETTKLTQTQDWCESPRSRSLNQSTSLWAPFLSCSPRTRNLTWSEYSNGSSMCSAKGDSSPRLPWSGALGLSLCYIPGVTMSLELRVRNLLSEMTDGLECSFCS